MAAVAADVPDRYDVVINGVGFMFSYSEAIKGESSYTPLWVEQQQNQQSGGRFSDNQFDFWMNFAQTDWSLGSQQRYFDENDENSRRQYWDGQSCNIDEAGEVTLHKAAETKTASGNPVGSCDGATQLWYADATNLYSIPADGAEDDNGAHDVSSPATNGLVDDENNVYVSSGTENNINYFDIGSGFVDVWVDPPKGADELVYHNNQIYGYEAPDLLSFTAAAGASQSSSTTIHSFLDGLGEEISVAGRLLSFGPKLYILACYDGADALPNGRTTELWEYDGTGVSKVADFPTNFLGWHLTSLNGIIFVAGNMLRGSSTVERRPSIFFYSGGQVGKLWEEEVWNTGDVRFRVVTRDGFLYWHTHVAPSSWFLNRYNPDTGAISRVASIAGNGSAKYITAASWYHIATLRTGETEFELWPHSSGTTATSGFIETSLFDAGSSLDKHWEDVIIDYDEGDDGDGGSIDVAYQMETHEGSYTSIQTGVVSGTAYGIHTQGQAIALKITLNKGTSTDGPKLKRIRLRGTPIHPQYRKERYVLNLGSVDGTQPIIRRDGTQESQDGTELAEDLRTAFTSGDDFSVTDDFGTYNAVFDTDGLRIMRTAGEEYIAIVELRES